MKNTKLEYDNIVQSVKMLNLGTKNFNLIIESGKNRTNKEGIGYDKKRRVKEE